MSDNLTKRYRQLRRQLRRATDAAERLRLGNDMHALLQRMTPKQREAVCAERTEP